MIDLVRTSGDLVENVGIGHRERAGGAQRSSGQREVAALALAHEDDLDRLVAVADRSCVFGCCI
jgi:hypothetical protein